MKFDDQSLHPTEHNFRNFYQPYTELPKHLPQQPYFAPKASYFPPNTNSHQPTHFGQRFDISSPISAPQPEQPHLFGPQRSNPWKNIALPNATPEEVLRLAYENIPLPPVHVEPANPHGPSIQVTRADSTSDEEIEAVHEYENNIESSLQVNVGSDNSFETQSANDELEHVIFEKLLKPILDKVTRSVKKDQQAEEDIPTPQPTPEEKILPAAEQVQVTRTDLPEDLSVIPEEDRSMGNINRAKRDYGEDVSYIPRELLIRQQQQQQQQQAYARLNTGGQQRPAEQPTVVLNMQNIGGDDTLQDTRIHAEQVEPEMVMGEPLNVDKKLHV